MKIGIDIGDTLLDRGGERLEEFSNEEKISAKPFEGSLLAVSELKNILGRENIFIISKCREEQEDKLLDWLQREGFVSSEMIPNENVYFCRERADKGPIIKNLGLDVFIDDRLEVFEGIKDFELKKVLFDKNHKEENMSFSREGILVFDDWKNLLPLLSL